MDDRDTLGSIMREIAELADGDKISLGQIVDAFERRGFGPLLLVPSLILVLPTGAIPGMPIVCGLIIMFVASQLAIGRDAPWIPARLKRMSFDGPMLRNGIEKIMSYVKRVDQFTGRRLEWLVSPVFERVIGLYCLIVALLIIPLGAIPFAIFPPALTILFMALGLVASDGLLIGAGLGLAGGFAAMGTYFWM